MTGRQAAGEPGNALLLALRRCRLGFGVIALCSLVLNVLLLSAPLYMLQVFDRVLSSRSADTLIYLTLIAAIAFLAYWGLDIVRRSIMVTMGSWLERRVGGDALAADLAGVPRPGGATVTGIRDLAMLRSFLTGTPVIPLLDAPWTPLFMLVLFMLHPIIGWFGLCGGALLFSLALANDAATRRPTNAAASVNAMAVDEAQAAARNIDVIRAMGMIGRIVDRWEGKVGRSLAEQARASSLGGVITATSRALRQMLQIGIMGIGAWLVLGNELSPGGMIAGSILMARALAPVEQSIEAWRSAVMARAAYVRLRTLLDRNPTMAAPPALPAPEGTLSVEGVTFVYPGQKEPALRNISFKLLPGESLGLIGRTASGKSTLARLIVGIHGAQHGHVRLDGADMTQWDARDRGQYVGYMPQDVELFPGTVRDNIARLGEGTPQEVYAAARMVGLHEEILRLSDGYDTEIGIGGAALSGGQRQKIALARAVFGTPRLVVLDEPNSNLDLVGESALINALRQLGEAGTTVVIIAHRPGALRTVDKIVVLNNGAIEMMGPRDEVFARVAGPALAGTGVEQASRGSRDIAGRTP